MRSTAIDRRSLLALLGAGVLFPPAAWAADRDLFLGARLNGASYEIAVVDGDGRDHYVLPIEGRGHSFALDPQRRRAVAFARQPGRFAVAFDIDGRAEPIAIAARADRHFFGHGIFTADGRLLLATENDYEAGRGVIGVYDTAGGYRRIGEFASDGIGPHEAVALPGSVLCIANGGILTHPDYDRQKLNLATMAPNLAYLDMATGDVLERVALPGELDRLSIRHLAIDASSHIWFGCQWEGDAGERPPLVGRHRRGRDIELFPGPADTLASMRNYVGSVAVDGSGEILATSSPHGGLIVFWDTATGRMLGKRELADGCGIAPAGTGRLMATSGRGAVELIGPAFEQSLRNAPTNPAWDNHLRRV
jgi:uncharacterized protein